MAWGASASPGLRAAQTEARRTIRSRGSAARGATNHRDQRIALILDPLGESVRFNLGELDIVKNQAGQTNIFSLGVRLPAKKSGGKSAMNFKKQTGYGFQGIDVLNVSVGKAKFIDLKDQRNNRGQTIGIENIVIKNVKSLPDLAGLEVLIALRGGDFFGSLLLPQKN